MRGLGWRVQRVVCRFGLYSSAGYEIISGEFEIANGGCERMPDLRPGWRWWRVFSLVIVYSLRYDAVYSTSIVLLRHPPTHSLRSYARFAGVRCVGSSSSAPRRLRSNAYFSGFH